ARGLPARRLRRRGRIRAAGRRARHVHRDSDDGAARRARAPAGGRRGRRRLPSPGGTSRGPEQARRARGRDRPRGGGAALILLVDNYDSFTYNLAHYLAELGAEVTVRRPEQLNGNLEPTHLVLSPGPGRPSEQLVGLVRESRVPTLGVCLGHQAVIEAFGG